MATNAASGADASRADVSGADLSAVGDRTPPRVHPAGSGPSITLRRLGWRWAARGVALVVLAITVMMIALGIGMRANDAAIDGHLGTATATVLSLSPLRTGIEFVELTGTTIRPEGGVLYPGLLSLGQQFVVEYSTQDPQIARVAGRTAAVGTVTIGLTVGLTYFIGVPLILWCRRRAQLPLLGLRRGPGHAAPMRTPMRLGPHPLPR